MSETVTGERISSTGLKLDKPSFEPLPAGDYELTLVTASVKAASQRNVNGVPYVQAVFETALDGKKRKLFHMFFLKNVAGNNGQYMWKRSDGILGYAKAIGDDFDFETFTVTTEAGEDVQLIGAPAAVKEWLNGKAGMKVTGRVKVEAGTEEYPGDRNKISYFLVENN